jgi:integrase
LAVVKHQGKYRVEIYQKAKRVYRRSGFETELEAKIHEKEVLENLEAINTGFIKLCDSRLEELELKRSEKHFNENLTLIKQELIPRWGRKKIISRDDVESYLNEVAKKSRRTANKRLRLVKALFGHGVKRGWLLKNPCTGIERFPVEKAKRYIPPEEDIRMVLELAECQDRWYLLTLAHTMGRMREVNRLKWEDVDFQRGIVTLYTRKAKNSDLKPVRVPMNDDLRFVLHRVPRTSEYVFPNPMTGKPYDHRDKFLKTLCRDAGVKEFTYHCLRHFGASKLDAMGAPISDIQSILGHGRATTTDNYLQSLRGGTVQTIKKLEGLR